MRFKYIGRITHNEGKRLFNYLSRLKNFGEGRIVYRNAFQRYQEPCYFIITHVEPDMSDPIGEKGKQTFSYAYGKKIFRGEDHGIGKITSAYKDDWKLVPKDQEENFLKSKTGAKPMNPIARKMEIPPLLELSIKEDMQKTGQQVQDKILIDKIIGRGVFAD